MFVAKWVKVALQMDILIHWVSPSQCLLFKLYRLIIQINIFFNVQYSTEIDDLFLAATERTTAVSDKEKQTTKKMKSVSFEDVVYEVQVKRSFGEWFNSICEWFRFNENRSIKTLTRSSSIASGWWKYWDTWENWRIFSWGKFLGFSYVKNFQTAIGFF